MNIDNDLTCEAQGPFLSNKEVNDIKEALQNLFYQRTRFIKSQFLLNNIDRSRRSGKLPEQLSKKVTSILTRYEIENGDFRFKDNDGNELDILGIHSGAFSDVLHLTTSEKSVLKVNLVSQLSRESTKFKNRLQIVTNSKLAKLVQETLPDDLCLNKSKIDVYKYYNQFVENVAVRNGLYEQTHNLLYKLVNLKYNARNKYFSEQLDNLNSDVNVIHLQARLFKLRFEHLILSINDKTFTALPLLYENMKQKEKTTSTQLNELKSQLLSYKALDDTEFLAIVKEYNETQKALQHMEYILEEMDATKQ